MAISKGFSLLELLIAKVVLLIALLALMQLLGFIVRVHSLSNERWQSVLEAWGKTQHFRLNPEEGEAIQSGLGGLSLRRTEIPVDSNSEELWEVVQGER